MEKDKLTIGLLAKEAPAVFDDLNNGQGTFLYNFNIRTVFVKEDKYGGVEVVDKKNKSTGTRVQYDSIRVEYPKTADNIFSTLLSSKYSANTERKMMNEYQSAELGLLHADAKIPYQEFLKVRLSIRDMVDADCEAHNIPNSI